YDWASTDGTTKTLRTGAKSKSSLDSEAFTGRVGLVYLFDNGLAPFVSYTESFLPLAGADVNKKPFEPSTGNQYEVGVKYQP
ncbi:TonB-dependent receptor domain-containing protein, partial [Pseudomonas bubulae]|uniref:TonB-dependent receptor domain-containing protein n=1 Tax=Pseudomonas bubulae TaxID=2316085 RepID=UPI002B1E68E2